MPVEQRELSNALLLIQGRQIYLSIIARSHAGRDDICGPQWPEAWTKMDGTAPGVPNWSTRKLSRIGQGRERIRILPVETRPTMEGLNLTADTAGDSLHLE